MREKKPLDPEVAALIPDGIENFVPHCIVCASEVPPRRRSTRSRGTCSPNCLTVYKLYRKHLLMSTKCIGCYHPSTPEERALFREWRKSLGQMRRKPGRPRNPIVDPFDSVEEPKSTTFAPEGLDIESPIR